MPALDWNITVSRGHVHIAFQPMQAEMGKRFAGAKKDGGSRRRPRLQSMSCRPVRRSRGVRRVSPGCECSQAARRVRTKFWPAALVQLSWLVETIRQLKLTGVWRISDVPWISTEVGPVMV